MQFNIDINLHILKFIKRYQKLILKFQKSQRPQKKKKKNLARLQRTTGLVLNATCSVLIFPNNYVRVKNILHIPKKFPRNYFNKYQIKNSRPVVLSHTGFHDSTWRADTIPYTILFMLNLNKPISHTFQTFQIFDSIISDSQSCLFIISKIYN